LKYIKYQKDYDACTKQAQSSWKKISQE